MPGAGLSGADPKGDYSDARGLQVLAALMDHLGVVKASLIGNSMGGKIAWQFAAAFPDRVDRLVLISPDGFASPGEAYGKTQDVPFMVALCAAPGIVQDESGSGLRRSCVRSRSAA